MDLEKSIIEGDNPVCEIKRLPLCKNLIRTRHEKSCLNLPGPSGKAKYYSETDSELVP